MDRALFTCRIRQHHATRKSPFNMVYGVEPKLPGDHLTPIIDDDPDQQVTVTNRDAQINHLTGQRTLVHQRLQSNAIKMKTYYDQHLKLPRHPLQLDDWSLLHNENRKKFQPHWFGPYKIRNVCPLGTYRLENVHGHLKPDLVHLVLSNTKNKIR